MRRSLLSFSALRLSRAHLRRLEASVPLFLCPALLEDTRFRQSFGNTRSLAASAPRRNAPAVDAVRSSAAEPSGRLRTPLARALPLSCPGCGAPTQTIAPGEAGYYAQSRSAVKAYLDPQEHTPATTTKEDEVFEAAVGKLDGGVLERLGLSEGHTPTLQEHSEPPPVPICDRCHNLIHHHSGVPIHHPSIESIEATISESPYKHNHIYHVLDAADFPMSLVPNLTHALKLSPLRTQNRRSKTREYAHGRVVEVSFIITRSDLLAPMKEQVDTLMPYLVEVLRDALGRTGKNVRLGNVHCVSARRGWWTTEVKQKIWERGGGGWLVGKVNVGKSNLFEVVFPKGRNDDVNIDKVRSAAAKDALDRQATGLSEDETQDEPTVDDVSLIDESSLLPAPQKETAYPVMPIISSLPGTTASPIRIPFGKGRGELIDLPGLARSSLDTYVRPEHKLDLVMNSRIVPERLSVRPRQSLLLGGGLIRIMPTTQEIVYLMHAFVPLPAHVTATKKALAMLSGEPKVGVPSIVADGAEEKMKSAGRFQLRWDVTRQQTGPLMRKEGARLRAEQLPFVVWAADILIEGVGWVEVVAQTRKSTPIMRKRRRAGVDTSEDDGEVADEPESVFPSFDVTPYPEIEVFSPEGKFISIRRPMNGWLLNKPIPKRKGMHGRPRQSMVSVKNRRQKGEASAARQAGAEASG